MPVMEETPYAEIMRNWFKRMGYAPVITYEGQLPVRPQNRLKPLTKKERERVDSLSRERGYREFCAFGRAKC